MMFISDDQEGANRREPSIREVVPEATHMQTKPPALSLDLAQVAERQGLLLA